MDSRTLSRACLRWRRNPSYSFASRPSCPPAPASWIRAEGTHEQNWSKLNASCNSEGKKKSLMICVIECGVTERSTNGNAGGVKPSPVALEDELHVLCHDRAPQTWPHSNAHLSRLHLPHLYSTKNRARKGGGREQNRRRDRFGRDVRRHSCAVHMQNGHLPRFMSRESITWIVINSSVAMDYPTHSASFPFFLHFFSFLWCPENIFWTARGTSNPVYARRVAPLALAFRLSLHRQSYIGLLYNSHFIHLQLTTFLMTFQCWQFTDLFRTTHTVKTEHTTKSRGRIVGMLILKDLHMSVGVMKVGNTVFFLQKNFTYTQTKIQLKKYLVWRFSIKLRREDG